MHILQWKTWQNTLGERKVDFSDTKSLKHAYVVLALLLQVAHAHNYQRWRGPEPVDFLASYWPPASVAGLRGNAFVHQVVAVLR